MTATIATRPPAVFHTPRDLEAVLGERIVSARPLAQACGASLIRLDTAAGASWVYKGQWGPSLEIPFYRVARSPLLPKCLPVLEETDRSALLIEYIDAPLLIASGFDRDRAIALAMELPRQFQEIRGDPPVLDRLDTADAWRAFFAHTVDTLGDLGQRGVLDPLGDELADALRRAGEAFDADPLLEGPVGLIHSDLHAENVFVLPEGGYRVIDWQWPRIAPLAIDTAHLLETLDGHPLEVLGMAAVFAMYWVGLGDTLRCLRDAGPDPTGMSERHVVFRISGILGMV